MKRIVLVILLLLAIALAAGHTLLVRQFEQQLRAYASQVAPHGRLTWDAVSINHSGEISVRQLRFQPHDSRDRISLEELKFETGSLAGLIQFARALDGGLLPSSLRVSARSLNLPVNRQTSEWIGPFNPGLPFAAAGCGKYDPFLFYHLGDIGLVDTTVNLHLNYDIVNQGDDLDLNAVIRASQLSESNIRLRLALDEPSRRIAQVPQTLARTRLVSARHTFTDLGFYPRLMALCAEHSEQEVDAFITDHINAWIREWGARGLEPGRLVLVAYRHFLLQPGTVTFATEPDTAPVLATFDRARFTRLVSQVPVQFSVEDGTPLDLDFGEVDMPPQPVAAPVTEPDEVVAPPVTTEEDDQVVVGPTRAWRSISPDEISNYIDHRATIETVDGSRFTGRILEVEDDAVYLSIQTRRGLLMRPISLGSIQEVRVRE